MGTEVAGVTIRSGSELPEFVRNNPVDIAVLTVPHPVAASVGNILADNGAKAVWNFTNVDLGLDERGVVVENIHFSDSLLALSYYLTEKLDSEKNGASK